MFVDVNMGKPSKRDNRKVFPLHVLKKTRRLCKALLISNPERVVHRNSSMRVLQKAPHLCPQKAGVARQLRRKKKCNQRHKPHLDPFYPYMALAVHLPTCMILSRRTEASRQGCNHADQSTLVEDARGHS